MRTIVFGAAVAMAAALAGCGEKPERMAPASEAVPYGTPNHPDAPLRERTLNQNENHRIGGAS